MCHIAASHLLQDDDQEYNFDFVSRELKAASPVLVNFCRREQGLLTAKGNPEKIFNVSDLAKPEIRIANRPEGTGTRLLLDRELEKAKTEGSRIKGYDNELRSHLDLALEIFSGRADAGLGIRAVADLLGLDFIPLRWERYDLLVLKEHFFKQEVQLFLGLLHEPGFREMAKKIKGYDLSICGKMVFPQQYDGEKERVGDEKN